MTDNALTIRTGNRGLQLTSLGDMERWAKGVIASGLAPSTLDTAPKIIVATQYGYEIGLTPMVALRSICVVKGTPTLWGDAALALVKKSGLSEYVKERVEGVGDKMCAYVESKRKDTGEIVETEFSVDDAKTANLWTKAGTWKTHPKRMLKYKARAFNLRDNFPDVLGGMHLTEEMEGEEMGNPLPAPACDTLSRENRRKKVDSTETAPQGQSAEPSTDGVTDDVGSADTAKTGFATAILDAVQDKLNEEAEAGYVPITGNVVATGPSEPDDAEVIPCPDGEDPGSPCCLELEAATALLKSLNDLQDSYAEKEGDDFTVWAAEVLCRGEDELEKPEDFTADMIEQLVQHLQNEGI